MIESLCVTIPAVLFLIVLFGGGALFRRGNIDMDGEPPIPKTPFATSKYLIVVLWAAMIAQSWGANLRLWTPPHALRLVSLCLWFAGFALLFIGRFGLGSSFRIGSAKESTRLRTGGLFGLSRNPMYVGVYTTLVASALYTENPILLFIAGFVIAVHHKIVLAEEEHLRTVFGEEYAAYCRRVRRYL